MGHPRPRPAIREVQISLDVDLNASTRVRNTDYRNGRRLDESCGGVVEIVLVCAEKGLAPESGE